MEERFQKLYLARSLCFGSFKIAEAVNRTAEKSNWKMFDLTKLGLAGKESEIEKEINDDRV